MPREIAWSVTERVRAQLLVSCTDNQDGGDLVPGRTGGSETILSVQQVSPARLAIQTLPSQQRRTKIM
jgi:hypothetical protein